MPKLNHQSTAARRIIYFLFGLFVYVVRIPVVEYERIVNIEIARGSRVALERTRQDTAKAFFFAVLFVFVRKAFTLAKLIAVYQIKHHHIIDECCRVFLNLNAEHLKN